MKLSLNGVHGLVGSSSSNPTMAMASIAGLPIVDLVLVGFMAGSPALRDQAKFPTFLRVNPSIDNIVRSIASLMQRTSCFFSTLNIFFVQPCTVLALACMSVRTSRHSPCVNPSSTIITVFSNRHRVIK